jgi:hypothetical protein
MRRAGRVLLPSGDPQEEVPKPFAVARHCPATLSPLTRDRRPFAEDLGRFTEDPGRFMEDPGRFMEDRRQ